MNNLPVAQTQPNLTAIQQQGAYVVLDQFGLIQATGADRQTFLNSQLTHDCLKFPENTARFAGYCSAKGRLLANFFIWQHPDCFNLLVRQDILENTIKRLSLFILRAKVKLQQATDCVVLGFINPSPRLLQQLSRFLLENPFQVAYEPHSTLIKLSESDAYQRYIWCGSADILTKIRSVLPTQISTSFWDWLHIQAGEAWISARTTEQFVPQMLNFEAIDAISFKKGCYPGQEVVARSQYLGKLKRKMYLAHCQQNADSLQEGQDVFAQQVACGTIVNYATHPEQGTNALIVLQEHALGQPVYLENATEPLHFSKLPYEKDEP